MAKVSILMNCYNAEKFLKEAIDSVYNQTFKDWEIIFIDNCSTDNSANIAKSYDTKLKYFKTPKNIPLGEARAMGLELCHGEYIGFLDSDDIYHSHKLEEQVQMMNKHQEYGYCYTDSDIIDESGNYLRSYKTKHPNGNIFPKLLTYYEVQMSTVLIRRTILLENNETFDPCLKFCPDYDLFMRLAMKNKICSIKKSLFQYRVVKNSLTKQTEKIHFQEINHVAQKLMKMLPNMDKLYPQEFNHWQKWLNKVEADFHILNADLNSARECLLKAIDLGERHKKRYNMSLLGNGLELLQDELKEVNG